MSGGHSEVVPRLPIPNRTVKRLSADDSADSCVKVGLCQNPIVKARTVRFGLFAFGMARGQWYPCAVAIKESHAQALAWHRKDEHELPRTGFRKQDLPAGGAGRQAGGLAAPPRVYQW